MGDALATPPRPPALIVATRPGNVLLAGLGCLIGGLAAAHPAEATWGTLSPFAIAFLVGALGTAGGNLLNDVRDRDLDRVAHPGRPIPSGALSPRTAAAVSAAFLAAAFLLALLAAAPAGALAAALVLLLVIYEEWLKARGLIGNLAVALAAGALFPLGAFIVQGALAASLILGSVAALAHLGRELLKDAEDAAADAAVRRTFAVRHGATAACRLAVFPLLAAVVTAPLPVPLAGWSPLFLAAILPSLLLFLATASNALSSPHRAQRLAKAAMVLALFAFLAGSLL